MVQFQVFTPVTARQERNAPLSQELKDALRSIIPSLNAGQAFMLPEGDIQENQADSVATFLRANGVPTAQIAWNAASKKNPATLRIYPVQVRGRKK